MKAIAAASAGARIRRPASPKSSPSLRHAIAASSNKRHVPVKAILCHAFRHPRRPRARGHPGPDAGPGEVVAKVAAVGLNFFDTLIIAGKYQKKPPFPFSPGGEFAGAVERVGPGVTEFQPGDRVMGYTNFNAARERIAVAADKLVKLRTISIRARPALTITYGTATTRSRPRPMQAPARPSPYSALRRRGPRGGRARQAHGRAGDRLRRPATTSSFRARAWRGRGGELRQRGSADALKSSAATMASTSYSIPSAGPTARRRCARSPGRDGISSSALPPARSPNCRSI